jgi:hypothetical protein
MTCTLFGQVDIYLSGSLEIVLEGEVGPVELDGLIDIKKRGTQNIYLEGILNDPNLEGTLETIVNLEGCLIVDKDPPLVTPTASPAPDAPIECDDNVIANESGSAKLFKFEVELGSGTGFYGIDWFMGGYIPDRFVVFWDGNTVIDTGWVGPTNAYQVPTGTFNYNVFDTYTYTAPYINFGSSSGTQSVTITSSDINLGVGTSGLETFNKTASSPTTMEVWVYSHPTNNGTVWQLQPNCAPGISATPSVTPTLTPTMSITPTVTPTVTPSSSVAWDYFSSPTLCCNSTDTPITGNIAILSSYSLDSGDITIINGHAYTLGTKQTAVGDETFITDIVGLFATCEQAVGYAVTNVSGTTSGCRYTFSACCGVDSIVYVDSFSIQGANPSSYAVIGSWILNAPYSIVDTSGIINVCVSLNDYNSSVTIDNTELTNYSLVDIGYNCGQNRCSRCAYLVEPCSDPGTYLKWVVNPNNSYDYEIGDVFSGSNINGYQVSSSSYEITGHCLSIVDNTSTPIVGGAVFTVNEGYNPGDQEYGTHTIIGTGCGSPVSCAECATNFILQNNSLTQQTITYNLCDGTSDSTTLPAGSKGSPSTVTVTECVDMSTIVFPASTFIQSTFDYCE